MTSFFIIATVLIFGLIWRWLNTRRRNQIPVVSPTVTHSVEDANTHIKKLDELGYFKYVLLENMQYVKDSIRANYEKHGLPISEVTGEDYKQRLDLRYFGLDGEDLYEQGGLINALEFQKPYFDRVGLIINVEDHYEEWDENSKWLNHTITINGNQHVVFKNFQGYGWGEAAQRLAEILNFELEKQNKEDRVYLLSGGNDGTMVYLSEPQFKYISTLYKDDEWKPRTVNDWAKFMKVKPMDLD